MERSACFAETKQSKSGNPAVFACAAASAMASILMIGALSLSLGVLLVAVLCGILIRLAPLTMQAADGNQS